MRAKPMFASNKHLTDHDLLRCLDDELSTSRKVAIDRHLRECETCRRRRAAIEQTAAVASHAYRAVSDTGQTLGASRERLMDLLSREARASASPASRAGVTIRMATPRRALAWSAATAIAAMVAWMSMAIAPAGLFPGANPGTSLPMSSITPGATWEVTAEDLCAGTRHTRTITAAMRTQVLNAYGMERVPTDQYELDYLITPELGGATLLIVALERPREGRARESPPSTRVPRSGRPRDRTARDGGGLDRGLQEVLQYGPAAPGASRAGERRRGSGVCAGRCPPSARYQARFGGSLVGANSLTIVGATVLTLVGAISCSSVGAMVSDDGRCERSHECRCDRSDARWCDLLFQCWCDRV
jgi:hypothetical protein